MPLRKMDIESVVVGGGPVASLVVLRTQDGEFCIDTTGKKNGRGAYICKNPQCLQAAVKNHGLERSFKTSIPKETAVLLEKEMEQIAE